MPRVEPRAEFHVAIDGEHQPDRCAEERVVLPMLLRHRRLVLATDVEQTVEPPAGAAAPSEVGIAPFHRVVVVLALALDAGPVQRQDLRAQRCLLPRPAARRRATAGCWSPKARGRRSSARAPRPRGAPACRDRRGCSGGRRWPPRSSSCALGFHPEFAATKGGLPLLLTGPMPVFCAIGTLVVPAWTVIVHVATRSDPSMLVSAAEIRIDRQVAHGSHPSYMRTTSLDCGRPSPRPAGAPRPSTCADGGALRLRFPRVGAPAKASSSTLPAALRAAIGSRSRSRPRPNARACNHHPVGREGLSQRRRAGTDRRHALAVADAADLAWLPQETILFDGLGSTRSIEARPVASSGASDDASEMRRSRSRRRCPSS